MARYEGTASRDGLSGMVEDDVFVFSPGKDAVENAGDYDPIIFDPGVPQNDPVGTTSTTLRQGELG